MLIGRLSGLSLVTMGGLGRSQNRPLGAHGAPILARSRVENSKGQGLAGGSPKAKEAKSRPCDSSSSFLSDMSDDSARWSRDLSAAEHAWVSPQIDEKMVRDDTGFGFFSRIAKCPTRDTVAYDAA